MKSIITTIIFIVLLSQNTLAEEKNCNQYDKLSKEYAKCNSLLLKNKTLEIKENTSKKTVIIKDNTTKKINNIKDKFNKSDLKKIILPEEPFSKFLRWANLIESSVFLTAACTVIPLSISFLTNQLAMNPVAPVTITGSFLLIFKFIYSP